MIDVHCHLEHEDYDEDREEVIKRCQWELKALITSCAHPKNFNLTMRLIHRYSNFIFGTFSIHPIYVKEINNDIVFRFFKLLRKHREQVTAIGETGLDYYWVKDGVLRDRQKDLFRDLISLSRELGKPLVVHARESYEDCIRILEEEKADIVNLHMFGGWKLLYKVLQHDNWHVSMNAILLRSKIHKKIVRDMPLERIMLETDAPWMAPEGGRNEPLTIKKVAEKIAEIKNTSYEEVWKTCGSNAARFFRLPIVL